jgi:ATP-dependent RNA helicase DDX31/DBP7
VSATLN